MTCNLWLWKLLCPLDFFDNFFSISQWSDVVTTKSASFVVSNGSDGGRDVRSPLYYTLAQSTEQLLVVRTERISSRRVRWKLPKFDYIRWPDSSLSCGLKKTHCPCPRVVLLLLLLLLLSSPSTCGAATTTAAKIVENFSQYLSSKSWGLEKN